MSVSAPTIVTAWSTWVVVQLEIMPEEYPDRQDASIAICAGCITVVRARAKNKGEKESHIVVENERERKKEKHTVY